MSKVLGNRLERIQIAIEKGITGNPETGEVFGIRGDVITNKLHGYGYICFRNNGKIISLRAHQFIYYLAHGTVVDCIDHINGLRDDNRISNLRCVTQQENTFNSNAKGYSWHKPTQKWMAQIMVGSKRIHLGLFIQEADAAKAYQDAKEKYHTINN